MLRNEKYETLHLNVKTEKSFDEVLQEEFLRERAAVLAKAGEKLAKILHQLAHIEESIAQDTRTLSCLAAQDGNLSLLSEEVVTHRQLILEKINHNVDRFNKTREKAKIQHYYLIVTREALGLRKHHWVDELYCIPPKKKSIKDK